MILATHDDATYRDHSSDRSDPMVVADLMSTDLVIASPALMLDEALHLMLREHVRHLLVFDGQRLVGVVNDRDLSTYRSLARGYEPAPLEVVMHPPHCVCTPSTPLAVVARDMLAHRTDAAVVLEDTRAVGIFTAADALRCLAS